MKKQTFHQWVKQNNPELYGKYLAEINPLDYYTTNGIYNIVGKHDAYKIVGADYLGTEVINIYFSAVGVKSTLVFHCDKIANNVLRVGKTKEKRMLIKNNRKLLKVIIDNRTFIVRQAYFRCNNNKIGGRVLITEINGNTWEYYSVIGNSQWNLKTTTPNLLRPIPTVDFNVPVRKMKEIVFGDSNVKFVHEV